MSTVDSFCSGLGNEVIDYYLLSLSAADLLCGLLVVPLSVYPAIIRDWPYGDLLCRLTGYLEVTLWAVSVYTFMWISVDRYLAVRKPLRYETVSVASVCAFSFFLIVSPLKWNDWSERVYAERAGVAVSLTFSYICRIARASNSNFL